MGFVEILCYVQPSLYEINLQNVRWSPFQPACSSSSCTTASRKLLGVSTVLVLLRKLYVWDASQSATPSNILHIPSNVVHNLSNILRTTSNIQYNPSNILCTPSDILHTPSNILCNVVTHLIFYVPPLRKPYL